MERDESVVIVGGGAAGHAAAGAYRGHGGVAPVTVISADDRLPYFRPDLSKSVLTGGADPADIALDPAEWYREHEIDVRLQTSVTAIDLGERTLSTSSGPIGFGGLVLATGSRAATPPVPGADHRDVLTLRSAADAERLLACAASSARLVVVGSGFIGCELAASLRTRGVEIAMVSMEAAPQSDRLGDGVGALLAGWLRDLDVEMVAGAEITEIVHGANGVSVRLLDRPPLAGDAVVLATGASPNVDAWRTIVADADAVPVDATMATAAPGVYAVGDIADAFHPLAGRSLRVEHWGDAIAMGEIAGAALAGHPRPWSDVPGFWSEIAGRTVKYVAWGDGWDRWCERRSADGVTFWFERDGEVVGVLTVDHDEDLEVGQRLIARRAPIGDVTA